MILFLSICREKLIVVMVKAMKNPRSALCKTSIMTCSDIFTAYGEKLLEGPHLKSMDDLVKLIFVFCFFRLV